MIFPRPFLDPTKRGIERACDDHGYIAATKDEWSFDQFQSLMNQSKEDQKLKELLLQDNLVVFLHLLCCDSNGHAHRPFSSIYLNNVVVVDSVAEGVYNLLEDYYEDIRTAYVFTADHGMHDKGSHGDGHPSNTDTPLVVWGAGFKHPKPVSNHSDCSFRFVDDHMHDAPTPKEWGLHGIERVDVNQADIAPLMVVTICFPDFFPLKLPFKFYHPYLLIEFSGTQLFSVCLVL